MSLKSFFIPYHRYQFTTRMTQKTILKKIDTIHTGFWDFGWLSSKRFCGFTHDGGFIIRSTYPFDDFYATADIAEEDNLSTLDITFCFSKKFLGTYLFFFPVLLLCLAVFSLSGDWHNTLICLFVFLFFCAIGIVYLIGFRFFIKKTKALFEDLLML